MAHALLTEAEVAAYKRDGYLLYHHPVFPPDKLARLYALFEEHLAQKGDKRSDELDTPHFDDPRLLEFLLADEVLDLVEPVVGPDIGLWSSHFISKEPGIGRATPWHEDSSYWNGRVSTMAGICTVWLALEPASRANGCMRVIPGSHVNAAAGFSQYEVVDRDVNLFGSQIKRGSFDESDAVYFELAPGEASLHEARLIHGAEPNTSSTRRTGYTMRYFPASSKVYPEKNPHHKIWLARGRDLAGNRYENA